MAIELFSSSHQAPMSVEGDDAGEGQSRVWEQVSAVRSTCQEGIGRGQGRGRQRQGVRRVATAAASATLLCFVCALAVPEFQQWAHGGWPAKVGLLGTQAGAEGEAMVQKMYQEDPSLVKAWAKLSGSKQARIMLADAKGEKPDSPHFKVIYSFFPSRSLSLSLSLSLPLTPSFSLPLTPSLSLSLSPYLSLSTCPSHSLPALSPSLCSPPSLHEFHSLIISHIHIHGGLDKSFWLCLRSRSTRT